MPEAKHDFIDDNPYLVYSDNKDQAYGLADLDALLASADADDAGKVLGIGEDGKVTLLTLN